MSGEEVRLSELEMGVSSSEDHGTDMNFTNNCDETR